MDVKAISAVDFQSRSAQSKKNNKKAPVSDDFTPKYEGMSSKASKAMRNAALGSLMATAALGGMSSCDDWMSEASASASASSSATAIAIGGGCHHDTITVVKRDTITNTDTIINTIVEPIYVKDYPYAIGDSLIAQGQNIGVDVDGPIPDGSNNVVYIGSKAHNRYDNKFYESMVDSVGTNKYELAVVTKVVDSYGDKPKTYYTKSIVTDVPGRGIKITRFVADTNKKPGKNEQYKWNYAGYEVRTNYRDGRQNVKTIFDNENNLIYKGRFTRGEDEGTFMYNTYSINPSTGEIVYDRDGEPVEIQYDFDQAVIYSDYARPVGGDYEHPGWQY